MSDLQSSPPELPPRAAQHLRCPRCPDGPFLLHMSSEGTFGAEERIVWLTLRDANHGSMKHASSSVLFGNSRTSFQPSGNSVRDSAFQRRCQLPDRCVSRGLDGIERPRTCPCGEVFDMHGPKEVFLHVPHITAAEAVLSAPPQRANVH
jgi:hypothetical protein